MEEIREINEVMEIVDVVENVGETRQQRRMRDRLDPYSLPDREFKARFRFSKNGVTRLTDLLKESLMHKSNQGVPFNPVQVVCCALDYLGGGALPADTGCMFRRR